MMIDRLSTMMGVVSLLAVLVLVAAGQAQIGIIWEQQSNAFAYLGSANMDEDPNEELVYFNPAPDRIVIFDGISGNIDWDSGEWDYIGIAGYIGSDGQLRGNSPFCDINNDGIKEITFRGQQYVGAPFTIYVVGNGGYGVMPGGGQSLPKIHVLSQNFPNPFNPSTTIQYSITSPDKVSIRIYNSLGQEITTVVDEFKQAGDHAVVWNGQDRYGKSVASGTYFYQMQVGDYLSAKKAILVK